MLYQDWRPVPQIDLLYANTGLLLSSLCLQSRLASIASRQDSWVRATLGAGLLTVLFLGTAHCVAATDLNGVGFQQPIGWVLSNDYRCSRLTHGRWHVSR